ncbi:unnamed protein product [Meloidogyne enterolobii]|uniref:Uncharacterized protein n=1 Tax=Meloidogyne enterolobii TaxID=390850 RepID=A0ACB0Z880_MELEN
MLETENDLINILKIFTKLVLKDIGDSNLVIKFEKFFGNGFYNTLTEIIDNYTFIFEQLQSFPQENTLKYKNIFIIWHLFAITRKVIRNFALFHNSNDYYKEELRKYIYETNNFEEISMFGYAEAYDIFEVKANLFMKEFRNSRYFYMHYGKIIYEDDRIS